MQKSIVSLLIFTLVSVPPVTLGQTEPEAESIEFGAPAVQTIEPEASTDPNSEVLQFENWALRCTRSVADGPNTCTMFQRIANQEGRAILNITLVFLEAGKDASVIYNTPLGVSLQFGLVIEVENRDGSATFRDTLEYTHCNQNGCFAYQFLDEEIESLLTAGRTLNVKFSSLQDQTVRIPTSLLGFTAGFESLREKSSE